MPILPREQKSRVYLRRKSIRMGNYVLGAGFLLCGILCYEVILNREQVQEMNSSDQVWSKINEPLAYNKTIFSYYLKQLFNQ